MVFKKRGYRAGGKKKMYKRRKYSKGKRMSSRFTLTNVVDTVVRRTTELKKLNTFFAHTWTAGNVSNITAVSQVPTGNTSVTKVGDQLMAKSLSYRYALQNQDTSVTASGINSIRIIVFQWYPLATTVPLVTDVLETNDALSDYRLSNRQLYKILLDITKPVVPLADSASHLGTVRVKIPKRTSKLNFTTGTVQSTNSLYVLTLSVENGSGVHTDLLNNVTLYFYDS